MVVERCSFRTARLVADEWHRSLDPAALAHVVAEILTPGVTDSLPPGWQGPYDTDRAGRWIADRDGEATPLLVSEHTTGRAIGLVLLYEEAMGHAVVEIRLGYLLAEQAWGQGLGGELVAGVVHWCRSQPEVTSIVGGVASENVASIRILERSGFRLEPSRDVTAGELEYRLTFER